MGGNETSDHFALPVGPFADIYTCDALAATQKTLKCLRARTLDRLLRGVEGESKP